MVMARPGHVDLEMDQIVAMFQNETRDPIRDKWLSAYIEYTPISSHFDELKKHVEELELFNELKLRHQNIWIGDGQTLGKMHFDEFENAMVMIKGRKQFLVYDPRDNKRLYEGHIPEARFEVKNGTDLRYSLHRTGIKLCLQGVDYKVQIVWLYKVLNLSSKIGSPPQDLEFFKVLTSKFFGLMD